MSWLYKLANELKIIIEEDLACENTSKETVENMDYHIEHIVRLWEKYKREYLTKEE